MLIVIAWLAAPVGAATPQTYSSDAGLYGLLSADAADTATQTVGFLGHSAYAGIAIRTFWNEVETVSDSYDWSYIDAMVSQAQGYGKKIALQVNPGYQTPEWVYEVGADSYYYWEYWNDSDHVHTGDADTLAHQPVPWDPVYLAEWCDFVIDFGARYNGNPAVSVVQITGPGRGLGEMYLTYEDTDNQVVIDKGYTAAKLVSAWQTVIDTYAAAFPEKMMSFHLSEPLLNDSVCETVADYGTSTYPWKFIVSSAMWTGANSTTFFPVAALLAHADEFTHGGVESGGISDPSAASDSAIAWHTLAFVEVYWGQQDSFAVLASEIDKHRQMIGSATFDAADTAPRRSQLMWTNPSGYAGFEQVKILRRTGQFPAGQGDSAATVVYQGTAESHLDTGLASGTTYYYSIYECPSLYTIAQDTATPTRLGDFDIDGVIGLMDLQLFNTRFLQPGLYHQDYDINGAELDGVIDFEDLAELARSYGM